jgi:hypothetical protein
MVKSDFILMFQIGLQLWNIEVEINTAWEMIRDNIKMSAKDSPF